MSRRRLLAVALDRVLLFSIVSGVAFGAIIGFNHGASQNLRSIEGMLWYARDPVVSRSSLAILWQSKLNLRLLSRVSPQIYGFLAKHAPALW